MTSIRPQTGPSGSSQRSPTSQKNGHENPLASLPNLANPRLSPDDYHPSIACPFQGRALSRLCTEALWPGHPAKSPVSEGRSGYLKNPVHAELARIGSNTTHMGGVHRQATDERADGALAWQAGRQANG